MYNLARKIDNWTILEGCVAITLGCAAGLRPQEIKQLYAHDVHHLEAEPYVYVEHVKGEGSWGRKRKAPLNDGVSDIIEKYLQMRERKLEDAGMMSEAMFPSFRTNREFVTQQYMSRFKGKVQKVLDVKPFELKDAAVHTVRGCWIAVYRLQTSPTAWGTIRSRPLRSSTRTIARSRCSRESTAPPGYRRT